MAFLIGAGVRLAATSVRQGIQAHNDHRNGVEPEPQLDRWGNPKTPHPVYGMVRKFEARKGKSGEGEGEGEVSNRDMPVTAGMGEGSYRRSLPPSPTGAGVGVGGGQPPLADQARAYDKAQYESERYGPQDVHEKYDPDGPPSYETAIETPLPGSGQSCTTANNPFNDRPAGSGNHNHDQRAHNEYNSGMTTSRVVGQEPATGKPAMRRTASSDSSLSSDSSASSVLSSGPEVGGDRDISRGNYQGGDSSRLPPPQIDPTQPPQAGLRTALPTRSISGGLVNRNQYQSQYQSQASYPSRKEQKALRKVQRAERKLVRAETRAERRGGGEMQERKVGRAMRKLGRAEDRLGRARGGGLLGGGLGGGAGGGLLSR